MNAQEKSNAAALAVSRVPYCRHMPVPVDALNKKRRGGGGGAGGGRGGGGDLALSLFFLFRIFFRAFGCSNSKSDTGNINSFGADKLNTKLQYSM